MFFLKKDYTGLTDRIEIYDDEIYTTCFNCGKEFQVNTETLAEILKDGSFSSSISCCGGDEPRLIRIK